MIFLLLLLGFTACAKTQVAEPLAVSDEPGVVTVFKSPT
jgi:hypothetical protein